MIDPSKPLKQIAFAITVNAYGLIEEEHRGPQQQVEAHRQPLLFAAADATLSLVAHACVRTL